MYKIIRAIGLLLVFSLVVGFLSPVLAQEETSNPYGAVRLSRLSLIEGEVLLQRGDDEEWVAASVNMPLRPHDKLWTTNSARAEVQFDDGTAVRLAENTNMDLLDLESGWTHLQLTLGVANFIAVRSASRRDREETFLEVDTPQAAIRADRSAKFRVDVAEDGSTEMTVREGEVELSSDQEPIVVAKNQRVVIEGGESPRYLLESAQERDEWDRWNEDRDNRLAQARSSEYLSPSIAMGATELDTYGQWTEVPTYGRVWAPRVSVGWAPYQAGRWVWVEPWGWTWVSYEPWGWIPYHHGRWVVTATVGWVWVPGPALEVWTPGCVRFIYGPDWVAWVPLGPGEVYYYNPGVSVHLEVNLINYRVPGAVVVVSRQTFVTGVPVGRRFVPPRDPIRAGRMVAGPPPVVPTRASLRPAPHKVVKVADLPPRVIQRPVVYRRPASPPPVLFDHRVKEVQKAVKEGRPPIVVAPRAEERRMPRIEDRGGSQKIHKDIMVRKTIRETAREAPQPSLTPPTPPIGKREPRPVPAPPIEKRELRPPDSRLPGEQGQAGQPVPHPPDRKPASPPEMKTGQPRPPKQVELGKKEGGKPETARPLYRESPKPEKKQGPVPSEKPGRPGVKPNEKERRSGDR